MFESANDVQPIVDPHEAAEAAGLRYVSDSRPGIRRRNSRKVFTYTRADGSRLTEAEVLRRIKSLAVPPAWTDVWICPSADGHIQATGRDAGGRKQYRYHPRFRALRESTFVLKVNSQNKLRDDFSGLKSEEATVLAMLRSRLGHEISRDHQLSSKTRQIANTA